MIRKHSKLLLFFCIFFCIFIILGFTSNILADDDEGNDEPPDGAPATNQQPTTPTNTNSAPTTSTQGKVELQVPLFGYTEAANIMEYIGKIFEYSMYILIPLAILMILFGGFMWILALGNPTKIAEAKKYITSATLGLTIGLLTYVILSLIGITTLSMPQLEKLQAGPDENFEILPYDFNQAAAAPASIGGQCFPVASGDVSRISWNFGDRRSDGSRCHAGVDIMTTGGRKVVAIADGEVMAAGHFYGCSGGSVDKVLVYHGSFTVNYGEIDSGKIAPGVTVGAKVKAGQYLGYASRCGMLHFELYQGKATNQRWYPPSGKSIPKEANYCVKNYLATKPAELMDPTNTLKELESKKCSGQ